MKILEFLTHQTTCVACVAPAAAEKFRLHLSRPPDTSACLQESACVAPPRYQRVASAG
jgi:hypothetical protein